MLVPRLARRRRTRRPAGSPPAYRRVLGEEGAVAQGGVDAAGQQRVGVGLEHVHRPADQRVPALVVTLVTGRLTKRTTSSARGCPARASASGTRSHSDSARSSWAMSSAAPAFRREGRRGRMPPGCAAGRERRSSGRRAGSGSPVRDRVRCRPGPGGSRPAGVGPSPFVGHQIVIGRLAQQGVPELQEVRLLAQHVGVQRLPQDSPPSVPGRVPPAPRAWRCPAGSR